MNTIENNKIIAEFMGGLVVDSSEIYFDVSLFKNTIYTKNIPFDELLYNEDWNCLMEVVEKIESLDYWVEIRGHKTGSRTAIGMQDTYDNPPIANVFRVDKIESVYNACLEFIKWYNLND